MVAEAKCYVLCKRCVRNEPGFSVTTYLVAAQTGFGTLGEMKEVWYCFSWGGNVRGVIDGGLCENGGY